MDQFANVQGFMLHHGALGIGAAVLATLIVGYVGAPLFVWTALGLALLVGYAAPMWSLIAFAAIALLFNIKPLRAMLVSLPVMKLLNALKFIPQISETERTAIEAGAVWVESDLFSGKPDFKKLMSENYPKLTKEEQAFIDGPVEKLCSMVDDWKIWEERELSPAAWEFLKKERFLGMIIPKEYGGLGFSAMAHSEVIQKLASRSIPACITVMVPNSLGPAELINHYGTDAQKKYYLPRLAVGDEIPCFALTEPGAGSDAGGIQAEGILFKGDDGKLYIRLNWNKRWITLAAISTLLGLAFKLRDPNNLLGRGSELGITCAMIPYKTPGVVLGRRHDPMGVPFYNCPTQGKDVVVSVDAIVGGLEGAGQGWKMLMECLSAGRGISLPAQSAGGSKVAARVAANHAFIRKQFGVSISKFEGIEEPLARMGAFSYAIEAMRRYTLGGLDKGIKPAVVTAIAKYEATELGRKVVNDAMDVMGGAAISRGPRNLIAHTYIATPIGVTVEGANILTRTLMIFGQGALRAHPYAFKEVDAIGKNDLKGFDRAFWGHIGHVVRNLCRSFVLSVTRGRVYISPVGGSTAKYYRKLAWVSASFAIMADIAMGSLGGALKMKEKLTGRFADILAWMYIGTAVLRRYEAEGRRREDLPFVHYSMNYALTEIQHAFDGIFANLPVPGLTWFFKYPIRLWSGFNSLTYQVSDKLSFKITEIMTHPSEQRDRMAEGIFIPKDGNEALARQEAAFKAIHRAESIEKKVRAAVKSGQLKKQKGPALYVAAVEANVISKAEHEEFKIAEEIRYNTIQVDDFSQDEYLRKKPVEGSAQKIASSTPNRIAQ